MRARYVFGFNSSAAPLHPAAVTMKTPQSLLKTDLSPTSILTLKHPARQVFTTAAAQDLPALKRPSLMPTKHSKALRSTEFVYENLHPPYPRLCSTRR